MSELFCISLCTGKRLRSTLAPWLGWYAGLAIRVFSSTKLNAISRHSAGVAQKLFAHLTLSRAFFGLQVLRPRSRLLIHLLLSFLESRPWPPLLISFSFDSEQPQPEHSAETFCVVGMKHSILWHTSIIHTIKVADVTCLCHSFN